MRLFKNILYVTGVALLAASCNDVDFKKSKSGMPYKLYASKQGKKVETGKFVKMNVEQKIKDSVVFTSYTGLPVYFQVSEQTFPYDPSELFTLLKEGDSLFSVQMVDTFIKRNPMMAEQTGLKNGDKITTTFKIVKVFDKAEDYKADEEKEKAAFVQREEGQVKEYLSKKGISNTLRTEHGAQVEVLNPGTGAQADSGKYVTVMYKGTSFSGKVFDSNMDSTFKHTEPLGFTVGVGEMIRGFDEGVRFLKQGGKGRIYIPSTLAYGGQPPSKEIKPYEHLVFDVEVVSVQDKAPAQPGQPAKVDPAQAPQ